ncbi:hypothetical protein HK100_001448 [Physocladia obscura]|uniref:Mitochondrial carrier protein n=1 Tax=Physocladia obscura TaxID=109957 RepID=A0AAD5XBU3_9FUNG|nr:hypothetical protein HK100_001448 [Physocladia obscura]
MSSTQQKHNNGIAGAAAAGFLELTLFHPMDTIGKRLINDRTRGNLDKAAQLPIRSIIFKNAAGSGIRKEIASLYPAFGFALLYKVLQRSLQFGIHPIINSHLRANFEGTVREKFGKRWTRSVIAGTGGMFIGCSEVLLLPLDALKVKAQTGVKVFETTSQTNWVSLDSRQQNQTMLQRKISSQKMNAKNLIQNPRLLLNLYRGGMWTAARNSIGCFALFGTSTFVKDNVYNLYDLNTTSSATIPQLFTASLVGACASILVAAPLDVIKVRMQATSLNASSVSGIKILTDLIANEGVAGLLKGTIPKLLSSAPKVTFSFTVAQWIAEILNSR